MPWGVQYQGPEVRQYEQAHSGLTIRRMPYAFPSFTTKSNTKVLAKVQLQSIELSAFKQRSLGMFLSDLQACVFHLLIHASR